MVSLLSKDNRLPGNERTVEYAERLRCASPGAKIVKLADILANLESMAYRRLDAAKTHKKAAKLRTYLIAIRPGIDADLSGLSNMQGRLAERRSG